VPNREPLHIPLLASGDAKVELVEGILSASDAQAAAAVALAIVSGTCHAQSDDAPELPLFRHASPKAGLPIVRVDTGLLTPATQAGRA
jgi:hypothetical protein